MKWADRKWWWQNGFVHLGPITLHGGIEEGLWGFNAFGWWGILRAPWHPLLFSERCGYERMWPLGFGWRCKVRRMRKWEGDAE